jgi:hypothetical protein
MILSSKFILLVESYFTQRDYRRYGIDILLKNGFQVEVWEIFRPFRRQYAESYVPPDPCKYSGLYHFTRLADICQELQRVHPCDVVLAPWGLTLSHQAVPILQHLSTHGLYYGSIVLGSISMAGNRRRRLRRTGQWLRRLYRDVLHRVRDTKPWPYILLCGGTDLEAYVRHAPTADQIWAHALDYDLVLEAGDNAMAEKPKHIVFLDEYVPFHPDYVSLGIPPPEKAGEYYPKLMGFFETVERRWQMPVVIAAHPRSKYDASPEYFGGREVVQGQICRLIRDAALVITHCSVANNFTAIYRKPALVVITNGLRRSIYGPYIESMAEALGAPLMDLDATWKLESLPLPIVDEAKYERFVWANVKRPGTPEKNTWQIFSDHVRQRASA